MDEKEKFVMHPQDGYVDIEVDKRNKVIDFYVNPYTDNNEHFSLTFDELNELIKHTKSRRTDA